MYSSPSSPSVHSVPTYNQTSYNQTSHFARLHVSSICSWSQKSALLPYVSRSLGIWRATTCYRRQRMVTCPVLEQYQLCEPLTLVRSRTQEQIQVTGWSLLSTRETKQRSAGRDRHIPVETALLSLFWRMSSRCLSWPLWLSEGWEQRSFILM